MLADNSEQLGSISIVGDTGSHANNIIDTEKIKVSNSVGNPLTLLNNAAGVHVTTGSSFGLYEYANQLNMRGFTQGQIAFLVDGVSLGSSATAGEFGDIARSSTYFVESPRTATLN